jgi:hypothetical protein
VRRPRTFAWVAVTTALALPVAGCAGGRLSLSVQKMCESAMGKWSPASETCVPTPGLTERDAKQGRTDPADWRDRS